MSARNLDDLDLFSKSDPFLVISRANKFGAKTQVHLAIGAMSIRVAPDIWPFLLFGVRPEIPDIRPNIKN